MSEHHISSRQNDRIKAAVQLRSRRERDATGKTLIEGFREISNANAAEIEFESIFYCDELIHGVPERALVQELSKREEVEAVSVTRSVFEKLSIRQNPDGLLAVASPYKRELDGISAADDSFVVVLVGAEKPGNIGAMLRTADAAGVDAVILCDGRTDLYNPNVIRSSMGTVFTNTVVEADSQETIEWLRMHDVAIIVGTPESDQLYNEFDMTGAVALVLGAEDIGVTSDWKMEAEASLSIPVHGQADSLNLSVAAGIMMYEVVRQRSESFGDDSLASALM